MTGANFDVLLQRRLELTEQVLASKATEYATNDDRLHNFKEAALLTEQSTAKALLGMLVKHWVSIQDMVEKLDLVDYSQFKPSSAMIDEKIGDAVNYLILLEAVLKEKGV